ncbi:proline-rich receptor-like protein kinase PERK5 [Euphorbia lathyris]|uniref:proline-rich receptor-like protein kinase PERK5 n=1 Tax=Euphorbia lathyris TaxID=212925 RepID=UPI0033137BF7
MVGYCVGAGIRMLVLELVPNNTLDFHLYGGETPSINWENRMKIALGVAKGLVYLHKDCDPTVIHRIIKLSNVLLDFDFEPKIVQVLEGDMSMKLLWQHGKDKHYIRTLLC